MTIETLEVKTIITNPKLHQFGGLPRIQTAGSAGLDLVACIDEPVSIKPQETHRFDLGFRIHINNPAWAAIILPRSGMGSKGLVLANTVGLIDSDYQGPLMAVALNRLPEGSEPITINPGDRIFQMVFIPVAAARLAEVSAFEVETERGSGGYGSTGLAAG